MTFNFDDIQLPSHQARPSDPIEVFQRAAVTDGSINDLWLAQGDALRDWHQHRNLKDVAIVLNTGAGKTLVGLLIAQSLVNETRRQVVYACSSIQLVEQTAEKARGYGLSVATYHNRAFSPDGLYQSAEGPCITTYQALFNGMTRFGSDDIAAVIFDDAHTAEHVLRDQFSLHISRSEMSEAYEGILNLFESYHNSVGLATSYAEMSAANSTRQFLVPPFEVRRNAHELRRLILNARPGNYLNTMFSWEHIRDHEDLCCLLISNSQITLTPPVVPVSVLPYFRNDVRRIYLSATLSAPDGFIRAFGRKPEEIIAPSTTAGECERMILMPSVLEAVDDDVAATKEVIEDHKTLILVPSFLRSEEWEDIAPAPRGSHVSAAVDSFRTAAPPEKLTLASRYDGIDLPGDTCRMLVLDELPTGTGPLERLQGERLNMQNSLRSLLASRIVQSFGRISRGMSDHGVILLTGKSLVDWLLVPRNRSLLPKFLQRQIEIGEGISRRAQDTARLIQFSNACLSRDAEWVNFYTRSIRELPAETDTIDMDKACRIALGEARFGERFWNRDFQRASEALNSVIHEAFEFSQYTGAWLSLWLGFALEMAGNRNDSFYFYRKAHWAQSNIPLPISSSQPTSPTPKQIVRAAGQMQLGYGNSISVQIPRTINHDLAALAGSGSSTQTEEALRCLGAYLGLTSTRPDNESGTGPDVLWIGEDGTAICMEVKTCKQSTSLYRKGEVGQLHNHIQWVMDNEDISEIVPIFVGPLVPASSDASPSPNMNVIELRHFHELGQRVLRALQDVADSAMPISLETELHGTMRDRGLLYPSVFTSMEMSILQDI